MELKTRNDRIVNADPATILTYIKNSNYGDHNLVIYPHLEQFEEFYVECCKDSILDKNEIFVVVTYYQPVPEVRKKLYLLSGIDAARYENNGTLGILDSEMAYQPSVEQIGRYNISMILTSLLINHAQEHDKKGVTLLADLGTFFLNRRIAELISHEVSVSSRIDTKIRSFCCYHKDDFSILQEEQRKRILQHHSNNLILD
ncbi:MAG: MEDS domain-containing protein [Nitrososphaeraceae archaeon]|nr:MEDS domain-containing protein [Nitrososphaeraceae archaeon]